jgi:hypothetical protein
MERFHRNVSIKRSTVRLGDLHREIGTQERKSNQD